MSRRLALALAAACLLADCVQNTVPGIEPAPATSFFGAAAPSLSSGGAGGYGSRFRGRINAYCAPYRTMADVVPIIGGAWRHCPQADENIVYPGTERCARNRRFQHRYPRPLLMEPSPLQKMSPYEQICRICREWCADK